MVDLATALGWIDAELAEHAVDHMLAWPKIYGLDPVLLPAVRRLTEQPCTRELAVTVDCATDRRGRPYSLICTKNQASYDRRVVQRKGDLEDLARWV